MEEVYGSSAHNSIGTEISHNFRQSSCVWRRDYQWTGRKSAQVLGKSKSQRGRISVNSCMLLPLTANLSVSSKHVRQPCEIRRRRKESETSTQKEAAIGFGKDVKKGDLSCVMVRREVIYLCTTVLWHFSFSIFHPDHWNPMIFM
jgi:hypothetical protein